LILKEVLFLKIISADVGFQLLLRFYMGGLLFRGTGESQYVPNGLGNFAKRSCRFRAVICSNLRNVFYMANIDRIVCFVI
jgi:hypothetical protein